MTQPGQQSSPSSSSSASGLTRLRALEAKLYSQDAANRVKQLTDEQRQSFVSARLSLTSLIDQLEAEKNEAVGQQLAQESSVLSAGIQDLSASLDRLDDAGSWAGEVNDLLGVVNQIAKDLV